VLVALKSKRIRVLIADDHELFLQGLHILLAHSEGIELVGEAKDGVELVKMAIELKPNVIVTDIQMPYLNGIDATRKIKDKLPHTEVMGLSFFANIDLINSMIAAGAKGYLEKTVDPEEVLMAIKSIHNHHNYFCKTTVSAMIANLKDKGTETPHFKA
jgi:DNA-binding NarL/FixJ family response regulator